MKYQEPLFRPPAEADSLIFQVAYGCPHNGCRFCGMYKNVRYRERDGTELSAEIAAAGRLYPATGRIFLADGDVMYLPYEDLTKILSSINRHFPRVARINSYANGSSIDGKTDEQLSALRRLKLAILYLGLESGDQELLDAVGKGETAETMISAVTRAQNAGFRCSVMVLLGLGGRAGSANHAAATAAALNRMQPRLLSMLRFIDVPGTKMPHGYEPVTEYQAVAELRDIISRLDLRQTVFRANHSSNPAPLEGRLPQDKERLSDYLDHLLHSGNLDCGGTGRLPLFL